MSNDEQDFRMELEIEAPRGAVLEALSTAAGIEEWWGIKVEGELEIGQAFRGVFGRGGWTELRLDGLKPGAVEWTCTAQDIADFTPTDEWVGTRIEFKLAELGPERTRLDFVHRGLRPLDCIDLCERGWAHHLGNLKQTAEGGARQPR